MTAIDWGILVLALLMVPVGYRQGLLVGALSLAGFVVGALIGSRLGPFLLSEGSESPYAPAVALLGGLLVGGVFAVLLEGLGISLRSRLIRGRALRTIDGAGGAAVLVVLAFAIAWVAGAVALNAPALKQYRDDIQRSAILSALNETFPPSGPILNALNRITTTPQLRGPSADVQPPKKGILGAPQVQGASDSVVRILGTACGLSLAGSGWVADQGLVVTNAHVIAGTEDSRVQAQDGTTYDAGVVAYRPRNDIAVLEVSGLPLEPLPLVDDPSRGTAAAIAGYPGNGSFTLTAARLGTTGEVRSQDSYGRGPIDREMTSFRGKVIGGNSGGPVIDGRGRVLTTVFASAVDRNPPEGLGVPNSVTRKIVAKAGGPVGTGPCT